MNTNVLGILLAILSTFFYSIMDLSTKWVILNYRIDHSILFFQSNIVMFILISIIGFAIRGKKLFKIHCKMPILLLRCTITFTNFYLAFYILGFLPLDIYYAITFLAPSMAAIMAVFLLKEHLNSFKIIALLLGLVGILIITNPFSESFNRNFIMPILITVFLVFTIALAGVVTRKYLQKENPLNLTFYIFFICSILGFITSAYNTSVEQSLSLNMLAFPFIVLIAFGCIFGLLLFIKAYQITPIQIVAPTEYILMIWGILFGYLFFATTPTITTIFGSIVIIASNFITGLGSNKNPS